MLTKERLLHPATIIATIALLVALSGAGYAATKIGTGQLKNNAVTTAKIKNNAQGHPLATRPGFREVVSAGKRGVWD